MNINKLIISDTKNIYNKPSVNIAEKVMKQALLRTSARCTLTGVTQNQTKSDNSIKNLGTLIHNLLFFLRFSPEQEVQLKKMIITLLNSIKRQERVLGEGFHETVYRIDDEFAVKMHPNEQPEHIIKSNDHLCILENKYSDLKRYRGGIVAKFGNFKILRSLGEHIPAGIPESSIYMNKVKYYREKYLPTFANVPQESYNELFEDCNSLNQRLFSGKDFYCHTFDYVNPNNIVLKDNKLYWVDEIRSGVDDWNATLRILHMMLNKYGFDGKMWIDDGFGNSLKYAKEIFQKIILAGANAHLPFRGSLDMFSNKIIENILRNLKIDIEPKVFVEDIDKLNKITSKEERVTKTKQYLENILNE